MGTVVVGVLVFGSAGLILWHMWRLLQRLLWQLSVAAKA